jgi:hypothetical protein
VEKLYDKERKLKNCRGSWLMKPHLATLFHRRKRKEEEKKNRKEEGAAIE